MNSLFGSQKATMKLKLKALPVFDKEKGAIFLKEMEVVDATVQPGKNANGDANVASLFKPGITQLL
ncbi:putative lipoprotein [Escherichia coli]|nr:putative lipoprotein [Escherichia coli]